MFVEMGEPSSPEGEDIVIDILSPKGYVNGVERGNYREWSEVGRAGILAVEDYR
jgi:hypothetical protein